MIKKINKYAIGDFHLRVGLGVSGKGLFATVPVPKNSYIIEYIGKTVPPANHDTVTGRYLFWAGKKLMIDGNIKENKARFINHSCKPNSKAEGPDGHIYIRTLRAIKPGEEITYDYGDEYFDEFIKPKGCGCVKCVKG